MFKFCPYCACALNQDRGSIVHNLWPRNTPVAPKEDGESQIEKQFRPLDFTKAEKPKHGF